MQIPRKYFVRRKISVVLRILVMALCSGVCWALAAYLVHEPVLTNLFGLLTCGLVLAALWMALKKLPEDRQFTLSPFIRIPAPIIFRGLDTSVEPIEYWEHKTKLGEHLFFTTRTRAGIINRSWFDEEQWAQLLASLPALPKTGQGSARESLKTCFVLFIGAYLALHWLGSQSDFSGPLQRLMDGAHSWPLIFQGEVYRLLSYAFLHTSTLHLLVNTFGLVLGAAALRRGYSNFSLVALMGLTAIVSVVFGSLIQQFDLLVGASGAVTGVFGFLVAAQTRQDSRLHPIDRVARHKFLWLLLAVELITALVLDWYAGVVHVVGFLAGFAYYQCFESQALDPQLARDRKKYQWAIVVFTGALSLFWATETYRLHKEPYDFVAKLLATNDPALTAIAALSLPDNPYATEAEVLGARQRALSHLGAFDYNAIAIARADFWLGNNAEALHRIRTLSETYPDDDLVIPLWLAIEQAHQAHTDKAAQELPNNNLPAGSGGAYLVSDDGRHLARLRFRNQPIPLSTAIKRPAQRRWQLIATTPTLQQDAEGIWPLKPNQFRTRNSAPPPNF